MAIIYENWYIKFVHLILYRVNNEGPPREAMLGEPHCCNIKICSECFGKVNVKTLYNGVI